MATIAKGHIEQLPSSSFRVNVYAGTDPVTGKERRLRETRPDETSATIALGRLLKQAEGHQAPERDALFGRVLDVYLEVTELAASTRVTHESYIRRVMAAIPAPGAWTPAASPGPRPGGPLTQSRGQPGVSARPLPGVSRAGHRASLRAAADPQRSTIFRRASCRYQGYGQKLFG